MNPQKTHDLNQLLKMHSNISDNFAEISDQCSDITAYGVQPRYPMQFVLEEEI
ncbi:HEPN domain-containing protein [Alkalicella caledoniensis]|uniref:HEPN domain-containing protein n=1 Tax=Alkalicella caledoniensis TaxID=2731377 RepID=UPI001FED2856|nr:HEPN domain-containing protein [Alkalicella caledoniensis]